MNRSGDGDGEDRLTAARIRDLLAALDEELGRAGVRGELSLVGGAVMCLGLGAREATRDVDAVFEPTREIREAAARVAARAGAPPGWLNDAVKGFLSPKGDFAPFLDLPNLRVYVAEPHYLLAMKCAAMRLGEGFRDLEDVRYLLRFLNVRSADEALAIVTRYFDERQIPAKTRFALEEILGASDPAP